MKRIVISILTAAVLIFAMASCGQKQDSGSNSDMTCEVAMIAEDRKTDDIRTGMNFYDIPVEMPRDFTGFRFLGLRGWHSFYSDEVKALKR